MNEAIERGWVCPDGSEHYWTEVTVGDRTVDERCDRCDALKSGDGERLSDRVLRVLAPSKRYRLKGVSDV